MVPVAGTVNLACLHTYPNEFLDLAVALPVPAGWPPYSTSIILATLVSRFALLPVSIWVHNLKISGNVTAF
jgi:inner membrane protein COX18